MNSTVVTAMAAALGSLLGAAASIATTWITRRAETIRANSAKLDRLITHRFPLSKVQDAWELQISGQCGKVLIDPWS